MAGSPHSTRKSSRLLIALVALLALIAAACGGSEPAETAVDQVEDRTSTASIAEDVADEATSSEPEDVVASDEAPEAEPASSDAPAQDLAADDEVVDDSVDTEDAEDASSDESTETTTEEADPLSQVLAFALEASETQSYSFSQGMAMRMNVAGMDLSIAPNEAYVFGQVEGDKTYIRADIGVIMAATFESLGIDVNEPPFSEIFSDLGGASMEMWTDQSTLVMDMSELANFMGGLDPAAGAELDAFADGPVEIDLTQLDGVDATTLANQFGQGAQVTDPAQLLQALRDVDAVSETGADTVNGVAVRVFTADMSMTSYYDALGIDIDDQLDAANLGDLGGAELELVESILPALDDLKVGLVVMIDDQDLVRRMETSIDMGAMLDAMFDNPEFLGAVAAEEGQSVEELQDEMQLALGGGIEMVVETWQEFDNYGESFGIVLPDGADVTSELPELLAG